MKVVWTSISPKRMVSFLDKPRPETGMMAPTGPRVTSSEMV